MKPLNRTSTNITGFRPIRVLQFGGGNFLRGFFDWMVDILNEETSFDGDVLLVKPTEGGGYKELRDQEGLFHTVLQDYSGEVTRLVTCIQAIINPYLEWQKFLDTASLPLCRFVVSNTTESGITCQPEELVHGKPTTSFPAKLTAWLYHRYNEFQGDPSKGMIILPTELIEDNGGILKSCVLQYATDWNLGNDFSTWIDQNNHFCNTLVDRIVSGFPKENLHKIQQNLGFKDQQLTIGEKYHQWVIEDHEGIQEELPLHDDTNLNVKFVEDLRPYREVKVRILNGAHTALVPIGMLAGLSNVYQVMTDSDLERFVTDMIHQEIVPTFKDPSIKAEKFADATIMRFKNPYINHQLKSISLHALKKFQVRLVPTISKYLNVFNTYPRKIMFCWAALLHDDADNGVDLALVEDWELMGLDANEIISQLRLDFKHIQSLGIRKALINLK